MHVIMILIIIRRLAGMMFDSGCCVLVVPSSFPSPEMHSNQMLQLVFTLFIAPALQGHLKSAASECICASKCYGVTDYKQAREKASEGAK